METKKLYLEFLDTAENTFKVIVDDPKASIDETTIRTNMDAIIAANAFDSKGHSLSSVKAAYIRETVTTKFV